MNEIMRSKLMGFLKGCKRKTVLLIKLQEAAGGNVEYESFARVILDFCADNILVPVKSGGENGKNPSIFYQYRINSSRLDEDYKKRIHATALNLHEYINLTEYFSLNEKEFEKDLPFIFKIDNFIKSKGLPLEKASSAERSHQIFDDEKVIDEKGGGRLLERLKLYDKMLIAKDNDPAMFFINRKRLCGDDVHYHLIVENRSTMYCLSEIISSAPFTSLIYGCGFKITSGLDTAEKQMGLSGLRNVYYYFGDLDNSGILIWSVLYEKSGALPAVPFYKALMEKKYFSGKENQKRNEKAIERFKSFFDADDGMFIDEMLRNGGYYPQETLTKMELHKIWSENDWTLI